MGAANLDSGVVVRQTTDVSEYFNKNDDKYGMGGPLKGQAKNFDKFVCKVLRCRSARYVSEYVNYGKRIAEAKGWMKRSPEESVFAVYVNRVASGAVNVAHWLNAKKTEAQFVILTIKCVEAR